MHLKCAFAISNSWIDCPHLNIPSPLSTTLVFHKFCRSRSLICFLHRRNPEIRTVGASVGAVDHSEPASMRRIGKGTWTEQPVSSQDTTDITVVAYLALEVMSSAEPLLSQNANRNPSWLDFHQNWMGDWILIAQFWDVLGNHPSWRVPTVSHTQLVMSKLRLKWFISLAILKILR